LCHSIVRASSTFPIAWIYLDKEVEEWHEEIEHWNEQEMFVFWCGNDYWCNKQGEVTSS